MGHQTYKGDVLTGTNNITRWKRAVKIHGDAEGTSTLWRHTGIGASRKTPESLIQKPTRPTRTFPVTREATANYREDIEIYKFEAEEYTHQQERERYAKQMFLESVDDHIKVQIIDKSSRDCWVYLSNAFAIADSMAQSILYGELAAVKLTEGDTMQQYLSTIANIKQDLAEHNETLTDAAHKNAILSGLPYGYNHLIEQLHFDAGTGTSNSVADLQKKLYVQESILAMRKAKAAANKSDKDKTNKDNTKNNRNTSTSDNDAKPDTVCTHCNGHGHFATTCKYKNKPNAPRCTYKDCNKLGHLEKDCKMKARALKDKESDTKPDTKRDDAANLALPADDFDFGMDRIVASCMSINPTSDHTVDATQNCDHGWDEGTWGAGLNSRDTDTWGTFTIDTSITSKALAAITDHPLSSIWICDSGASRHITNDATLFTSLQPCTETIGGCKKGSELEITGQGTIDIVITSPDGKDSILELHNVR